MNQIITQAIVLARTDYGEADRILTLLTPDYGKLRLMAKGVRRVKSKLAGGIELFSVTDITFIRGRGDIGTLISSRLVRHYGHIISDINRTMLGYELIRQLHKITEDEPDAEYFNLLEQSFAALDNAAIDVTLIKLWFNAQLLRVGGHTPNLLTAVGGGKLSAESEYEFSLDDSAFILRPGASFKVDDIKFLRLIFSGNSPAILQKIRGSRELSEHNGQLITLLVRTYHS